MIVEQKKEYFDKMKKKSAFYFIVLLTACLFYSCVKTPDIQTPEKMGTKDRTTITSGEEAIKVIDKLHGLSVAANANVIAEYGVDEKDVLYVSYYSDANDAQKYFVQMVEKMEKAEKGPFSHLMKLPDYEGDVYFTLGMGAIHYIYWSSNYILWLQTVQPFGRELPQELLKIYPIIKKDST